MSYRGRLDEPGFMEDILADIDDLPGDFWVSLIEKYDNEKPGDIVLPGVPPRQHTAQARLAAQPSQAAQSGSTIVPKKASRKVRKAA